MGPPGDPKDDRKEYFLNILKTKEGLYAVNLDIGYAIEIGVVGTYLRALQELPKNFKDIPKEFKTKKPIKVKVKSENSKKNETIGRKTISDNELAIFVSDLKKKKHINRNFEFQYNPHVFH